MCRANIWEIWQLFERLIELSTIFPLKYSGYFPFKALFWFPYRYLYVLNRQFPLTWKCFLYTTTRIGQTAMIVKFWTALGILSRTISVVRKTKGILLLEVYGWDALGCILNKVYMCTNNCRTFLFPLVVDRDKVCMWWTVYLNEYRIFSMGGNVALWLFQFFQTCELHICSTE